jgi:hypothetical protein
MDSKWFFGKVCLLRHTLTPFTLFLASVTLNNWYLCQRHGFFLNRVLMYIYVCVCVCVNTYQAFHLIFWINYPNIMTLDVIILPLKEIPATHVLISHNQYLQHGGKREVVRRVRYCRPWIWGPKMVDVIRCWEDIQGLLMHFFCQIYDNVTVTLKFCITYGNRLWT